MYQHGTIHIDEELQDELFSSVDVSEALQVLKDKGLLVVVEKQDFGWVQIDPPVAPLIIADEPVAHSHDHPVVENPPSGFANLG